MSGAKGKRAAGPDPAETAHDDEVLPDLDADASAAATAPAKKQKKSKAKAKETADEGHGPQTFENGVLRALVVRGPALRPHHTLSNR